MIITNRWLNTASILAKSELFCSQVPFHTRCRWWSKIKQRKRPATAKDPETLEDGWSWQVLTENVPSPATVRQSPADSCMLKNPKNIDLNLTHR